MENHTEMFLSRIHIQFPKTTMKVNPSTTGEFVHHRIEEDSVIGIPLIKVIDQAAYDMGESVIDIDIPVCSPSRQGHLTDDDLVYLLIGVFTSFHNIPHPKVRQVVPFDLGVRGTHYLVII